MSLYKCQKNCFWPQIFFATDYLNSSRLSQITNLVLNSDPEPKTLSPFSNGVIWNFFQDIYCISVHFQLGVLVKRIKYIPFLNRPLKLDT
jgi:hypothetical protein